MYSQQGERLSNGSRREKWTLPSRQGRGHDFNFFCLWASTGRHRIGSVSRAKKALLKRPPREARPMQS